MFYWPMITDIVKMITQKKLQNQFVVQDEFIPNQIMYF